MFGRRLLLKSLLACLLLASACTPKLPPETNRRNVMISVTNPTPADMSVTVEHVGGVWALGILPAFRTKMYEIRLLQDQPVYVVGANLWGLQQLRQSVYLSADCVATIVLFNAPTTATVGPSGPASCAA